MNNEEIPVLTYEMLEDVKYGDAYRIEQDSEKIYHCALTHRDGCVLVREDNPEGVMTFINKEKSKLCKSLVNEWEDFEIFPVHIEKVRNMIKDMEAKKQ